MEPGVDRPGQHPPGRPRQQQADDASGGQGQGIHDGPRLVDRLPSPARADLPAHDDGGGAADGEDDHGADVLNVAGQGPGGQDLGAPLHVAHDHLVEGGAQAPQGLVDHHRAGVAQEAPEQLGARPEGQGRPQAEAAVGEGVPSHDQEFHHPGEEGGQGGAGHLHPGSPQMAEDEHPVEEGVGAHGDGEDDEPQPGVLHAPVGPHVDAGDAVEEVGGPHDAGVARRQLRQGGIVGEQAHELGGEAAHGHGEEGRDGAGHVTAHADDPADAVGVPLAPVLADEDGGAALKAEDHQLDDKDGDVGQGHRRQGGLPQGAHHKGVHQPQGGGDEILGHNGQGQGHHVPVKGPAPPHMGQHGLTGRRPGRR